MLNMHLIPNQVDSLVDFFTSLKIPQKTTCTADSDIEEIITSSTISPSEKVKTLKAAITNTVLEELKEKVLAPCLELTQDLTDSYAGMDVRILVVKGGGAYQLLPEQWAYFSMPPTYGRIRLHENPHPRTVRNIVINYIRTNDFESIPPKIYEQILNQNL